ncbi:MAG: phosphonate metabolism transcriptional regulator PhnF, partial [Cyanobacteria bacterium P01_A01_bin.83]
MNKPIYTHIAEELKNNIQQQMYQPGDKLPTEKNLSARFNVNRHTIRNAIAVLKEEGLIRVDRGRGMFVAATPIRYPIGKRVRYNENLKAQGIEANYKTIKTVEMPADSVISKALKIDVGKKVVLIERLGLANQQPISIASSYFPTNLFPNLINSWQKYDSISKLMREVYDCDHIRLSTRISARIVKETDARLLKVSLNHPILLAE